MIPRILLAASAAILCLACGDGKDDIVVDPPAATGAVTGRVTGTPTGEPIAGAQVRVANQTATTGADGRYQVSNIAAGSATVLCEHPGLGTYQATITVTAGSTTHDFSLAPAEIFENGPYTIYVPLGVPTIRGTIIALGGPDTRSFITRGPSNAPESHSELLILGDNLRALASELELAVLGTSEIGSGVNTTPSALVEVVRNFAVRTARPELSTAPVLTHGISGGGPNAWRFGDSYPARTIGVVLAKPAGGAGLMTTPETGRVPTYVMLGELDNVVPNAATIGAFEANRASGALWALAIEPGITHYVLTPTARVAMVEWIRAIAALRLPATPGDPLREIAETSGWLANRATFDIAPWATYPENPATAAWLPTQATAEEWKALVRR